MLQHLRPALVLTLVFTLTLGILYPLAVTGVAQIVFPAQANGERIVVGGKIVGSELIGQFFQSDRYFHSRPSATQAPDPKDASKTIDAPYNASNSSGSNYGPTSQKLIDRMKADIAAGHFAKPVPADAVTASASGLDPHISPAFAYAQVGRVAASRHLPEGAVRDLVATHVEGRLLGILGAPRINVLALNLALDAATPAMNDRKPVDGADARH